MNGECHMACGQPSDQGRLKEEEEDLKVGR